MHPGAPGSVQKNKKTRGLQLTLDEDGNHTILGLAAPLPSASTSSKPPRDLAPIAHQQQQQQPSADDEQQQQAPDPSISDSMLPRASSAASSSTHNNSRPPSVPTTQQRPAVANEFPAPPPSGNNNNNAATVLFPSPPSHPPTEEQQQHPHSTGRTFNLPPPLPPMPAPPTHSLSLTTVDQARLRSAIQQSCIALVRSLTKDAALAATANAAAAAAAANAKSPISQKASSAASAPLLQIALFENNQCTWSFRHPPGDSATEPQLALPQPPTASSLVTTSSPLKTQGSDTASDGGAPALASSPTVPPPSLTVHQQTTDAPFALAAVPTALSREGSGIDAGDATLVALRQQQQHQDALIDMRVTRAADALTSEFMLPTGDTRGDIKAFRTRVRAAFAQQARAFRKEIHQRDAAVTSLRDALARFEPGGERFVEWHGKLQDATRTVAKQDEKIKSLVKLLERTGVAMKKLEKRLAEQRLVAATSASAVGGSGGQQQQFVGGMNASLVSPTLSPRLMQSPPGAQTMELTNDSFASGTIGSPGAGGSGDGGRNSFAASRRRRTAGGFGGEPVDWNPLYEQVRDFDVNAHDNRTIVRDIVELITNLKDQVGDLDIQYDTAVDRFNAKDRECTQRRIENTKLAEKLDEADALMEHMLSDIRRLQDDREVADLANASRLRSLEQEKEALQRRVIELEGNIAKSVEAKPFFVGLGRSLIVLPFLRFEGRVKNLDLPKPDVEAVVQRIWAKRDPERMSLRRAQVAVAMHLNAAYPGHAVYDPPVGGLVAPEDEITELVDYDNVKFVKRTGTSFVDFVTQLLIDKSASLLYGGEAFDFDATSFVAGTGGGKETKRQAAMRSRSKSMVKRQGDALRSNAHDWKNNPAFCVATQVAEIAYSLMEGCERFKYDADIELFRAIIREEVSELAWFDQMVMLAKLKAALLQAGRMRSGRTGTATVSVILQTLYEFFPCKDRESFAFLRNTLMMEARAAAPETIEKSAAGNGGGEDGAAGDLPEEELLLVPLSVHALFESNEFGNQGPFAEGVRDQHLEEACMYSAEVSTAASMCADPLTGRATIEDIRAALIEIDPTKPREEVDDFIHRVVAILLDEDGVDPFESTDGASTNPDKRKTSTTSSASTSSTAGKKGRRQSLQSNTLGTDLAGIQTIASLGDISVTNSRSVTPVTSHDRRSRSVGAGGGTSSRMGATSAVLSPQRSVSFLASGDAALKKQTTASFRAQEVMIMVEEGRRLKNVKDTDLVDCQRFATACRSVFSKRFGPRESDVFAESAMSFNGGNRKSSVSGNVLEMHEFSKSNWKVGFTSSSAGADGDGDNNNGSSTADPFGGAVSRRKNSNKLTSVPSFEVTLADDDDGPLGGGGDEVDNVEDTINAHTGEMTSFKAFGDDDGVRDDGAPSAPADDLSSQHHQETMIGDASQTPPPNHHE